MQILIKGGRVVDPGNFDGLADIFIEDGKIVNIKSNETSQQSSISNGQPDTSGKRKTSSTIDATGKIVTPGLVDMHVHLREPGQEYKETIESGCLAAASGGFTAICCMPNTNPVNDNSQVTKFILEKARLADTVRVYPAAAISKGLEGTRLCEYSDLKDAGAVAISDDGRPVTDNQLMRRAMEYAMGFGLTVISHCEDLDLLAGGVMNEGALSTQMGLPGIPNACESVMVMRDIALSELTGSPVHIAHVSTMDSVRAIRAAKKRGVSVTAETAPHYFTLTEDAVKHYNTNAKMNPPLRSKRDREAIRQGLADGTIDVIATDHAPHSLIEKEVEFDQAENGIIGLETSVSLSLKLVEDGVLELDGLIEKMSTNPARILKLETGLRPGNPADITIIDPDKPYSIDANRFNSLSRNTPFNGREVKGRAILTMVGGKIVFEDKNIDS
ncbi:MAG: dihydroorotase [Deltaproteobacteria bacterium]|nr:dihydroorotase [Deltaproteobacteria bacterium]